MLLEILRVQRKVYRMHCTDPENVEIKHQK